jgi:beta-glucosidase
MNKISLLLICYLILNSCTQADKIPDYKNQEIDIETRVQDLISRMTLEEKIKQMDMYAGGDLVENGKLSIKKAEKLLKGISVGSIHDFYPETAERANEVQKYFIENTRLGIPALFIEEALHGYGGVKSTAYPVPIGLGSMWDVDLNEKIGNAIGSETRSVGVHMVLAPVLGISREPRWGRVQETYGEDPYLAARYGVAMVKGMQADDLTADDAVVAEPKHFGIHSIPEGGKNAGPVYIGERQARSHFLYVFEKAFREAGALGAMAAYHEWDGIPAVSDPWLLKDLLRDEWGFKGFVLSDLGAIKLQYDRHKTAESPEDAIIVAVKNGLDMQFYDYSHETFEKTVVDAIENGKLSMQDIDRAVSGVLYVKFRLGLFENPYTNAKLKEERYHCQKHQDLALESAHKSIVMLQNRNNILPLTDPVKRIAVIGEMVDKLMLGDYAPKEVEGTTILEAFKNTDYKLEFVKAAVPTSSMQEIESNVLLTKTGEKGLLVEYFNNTEMSGEPVNSKVESTNLTKYWYNLSPAAGVLDNNFSVRWTGYIVPEVTGSYEFALSADDYARVTINGKVLIDSWNKQTNGKWNRYKIRLVKGNKYPIKLEYAELEENAAVSLRWIITPEVKKKGETMFEKAVKAASSSDVVVLVQGEKYVETGEGRDRMDLELNAFSKRLLDEISKVGKPIILVLQNGRPLVLSEEAKKVDAILETWYAGEFAGTAIVDIITGKVNPSGKLPISFPSRTEQLATYYNRQRLHDHNYVDGSSKPLFAFGHGLSYSKFEYSDLTIEKPEIAKTENQIVRVKVKNTSDREGTEVVQLYITDTYSSVATPVMQLRGFKRVSLKAGEEKEVIFTVLPDDLALWNREMKRVVESGEFQVKMGAASDDIRLNSSFIVK